MREIFEFDVRFEIPFSLLSVLAQSTGNRIRGIRLHFKSLSPQSKQKEKGKNMFANRWTLSCLKAMPLCTKRGRLSRWISRSGLLGAVAAVALAGHSAEAGGWLQKSTGIRTPESIRKIAPNGIQLPTIQRHNPPSHVTPNSVFNQPANSSRNIPPKIYLPANNSTKTCTGPSCRPPNSGNWIEKQRTEQERLRLQQQQVQLQQQQLRFQQDAMKAQQKAQVIGTIFQGIGSLIPQQQPQSSFLPYESGNGLPCPAPLNQYDPQSQGMDFSLGYDDPSLSQGLFDPNNP